MEKKQGRRNNQERVGITECLGIIQKEHEVQLSVKKGLMKNNQTAPYRGSQKRVAIKPHNVEIRGHNGCRQTSPPNTRCETATASPKELEEQETLLQSSLTESEIG